MVRIEKLDYNEYLRNQNKVKCIDTVSSESSQIKVTESTFVVLMPAEIDVKDEDVTEHEYIDSLKTPVKKEKSESCDVECKIEIEEDITIKTESSDLFEFIQETNEDPSTGVQIEDDNTVDHDDELVSKEDEKEEEFRNSVTIEEFFPHLSGCQE